MLFMDEQSRFVVAVDRYQVAVELAIVKQDVVHASLLGCSAGGMASSAMVRFKVYS